MNFEAQLVRDLNNFKYQRCQPICDSILQKLENAEDSLPVR